MLSPTLEDSSLFPSSRLPFCLSLSPSFSSMLEGSSLTARDFVRSLLRPRSLRLAAILSFRCPSKVVQRCVFSLSLGISSKAVSRPAYAREVASWFVPRRRVPWLSGSRWMASRQFMILVHSPSTWFRTTSHLELCFFSWLKWFLYAFRLSLVALVVVRRCEFPMVFLLADVLHYLLFVTFAGPPSGFENMSMVSQILAISPKVMKWRMLKHTFHSHRNASTFKYKAVSRLLSWIFPKLSSKLIHNHWIVLWKYMNHLPCIY